MSVESESQLTFYFIDAFTTNGNSSFTGNQAAVCFLEFDDDIPDEVKQKIATELNLSNTAFVSTGWERGQSVNVINNLASTTNGDSDSTDEPISQVYKTLRWFSRGKEVTLCGHASLAAVKALVDILTEMNPSLKTKDEILFEFESKYRGLLGATYNCVTDRITLNFPASPCLPLYADGEKWIQQLIDATISPALTSDSIQDIQYSPSARIILLRLGDHMNETDLQRISPNYDRMIAIENCEEMFGVLVSVKGKNGDLEQEKPHFYSRFFAPWYGVNEDPVCGSAHTVLAPYWTKEYFNGVVNYGITFLARQHTTRGGNLYCTLLENGRVTLGGDAKIIAKGHLLV